MPAVTEQRSESIVVRFSGKNDDRLSIFKHVGDQCMYLLGTSRMIEGKEKKHFILSLQRINARTEPSRQYKWQDEQVLKPSF
jgi:hypothetical protein